MTVDSAELKQRARSLGFELVGVAPASVPAGLPHLHAWVDAGFHAGMEWVARRIEAYSHPDSVLHGVRTVVMLGLNHHRPRDGHSRDGAGASEPPVLIAQYAASPVDYHDVLRERLRQLERFVQEGWPGARTRGVVDTAPLLERDFARLAGLGWFGKNTMLIDKRQGSFFFLGALLTDVDFLCDAPHLNSHCGTCTRCLEACPTQAFRGPYVLDAGRCISYLTIEHQGPIPVDLREGIGMWLFGCDVCQDVCPWNTKAPSSRDPAWSQPGTWSVSEAIELLGCDDAEFRRRFRHTPLSRPGRAGLLRNAAIVLGNSGDPQASPALVTALRDEAALVRGAAAWALGQLGGTVARQAMTARLEMEQDAEIRAELEAALTKLDTSRGAAASSFNLEPPATVRVNSPRVGSASSEEGTGPCAW